MFGRFIAIAMCAFIALASALSHPALAQSAAPGTAEKLPGNPVIAVVDIDFIMRESAAAKSVRAQAEKYRKTFYEEDSKAEASLQAQQQQLEQQRKTLSQDGFAAKAQEFDRSVREQQLKSQARGQAFEKSFNAAMTKVQDQMIRATGEIASQRGATMVMSRQALLMLDDRMDITKDIIVVMDKRLSSVDFPEPKVEMPSAQSGPAAGSGALVPAQGSAPKLDLGQ
jgi:Skp family chaperone for outer membrane proteins